MNKMKLLLRILLMLCMLLVIEITDCSQHFFLNIHNNLLSLGSCNNNFKTVLSISANTVHANSISNIGKLPNLSSGGVKYDVKTGNFDIILGSRVNAYSLSNHYISVLRLKDVKSVICKPNFLLKAVIYKKENDGSYAKYAQIIGDNHSNNIEHTGVNHIDFAQYKFDGYIRLAISLKVSKENKVKNCNILAERNNVLNNIFVEYNNNVVVEHGESPCEAFASNVRLLCNLTTRATMDFNYVSPLSKNRQGKGTAYPSFSSPSIGWYAGGFVANMPLCHVTWDSYCTATHNKWSRYYQARFNPADLSSDQTIVQQYGSRCGGMACYAYGWEGQFRVVSLNKRLYENSSFATKKFTTITNWKWENVRVGDMLCWPDHNVIVTDTVYVNGILNSIETLEFYPPYTRFRTIFFNDGQPNDDIAYEFSKNERISYIKILVRPNPAFIKRIEKVWSIKDHGFIPKYLMCDRGHNSVYTIQNDYVNMTVKDNAATAIIYSINKQEKKYINLTDLNFLTRDKDSRLYNIASFISKPGLYNLTLDTHSDQILESFYVPDTSTIRLARNGNEISISSPVYRPVYAMVIYGTEPKGERCWVTVDSDLIVNNKFVIEPYIGIGENRLFFNYYIVVFQTKYGTFAYRSDNVFKSSNM